MVDYLWRPMPPENAADFMRSPVLEEWLRASFIDPRGPLFSERHAILDQASIGVLWARPEAKSKGRILAGTAQIMRPPLGAFGWERNIWEWSMAKFFGDDPEEWPDFRLTFWVEAALAADDASWCALAKHELCHCAQKENDYGPMFHKAGPKKGLPVWEVCGHDIEQFNDVVEDFGIDATMGARGFIEASKRGPRIAQAKVALACGTCLAKAT